jgi:hypothetical protein
MTVRPVQKNEYVNTDYLSNVVKSTTVGAGAGLASKYLLPLTKEELGDLTIVKPLTRDLFEKTLNLKHIRPSIQFVSAGAIVGFAAGFIGNIFKTNA